MISFPNSKINIGLNVVQKRNDGYHDLETVFYPVAINDALEIIRSEETNFQITGLPINGGTNDNLCIKAYELLKRDFGDLPHINIHLHKAIPMGAGLGGGSADGAFMLSMLNKKFKLGLSNEQLISYALQLGSDCPFFIINKPCFATGRGENLTPVNLDLSGYKIVLVNPGIHVSTRDAFSKLTPQPAQKSLQQIIEQPISCWKDEISNDFEATVFALYPQVKEVKNALYQAGALFALMTGSGSSVFGIFEPERVVELTFPENYIYITLGKV